MYLSHRLKELRYVIRFIPSTKGLQDDGEQWS